MANSIVPDQMWLSVASDLDLHIFQMPTCPSTLGYYGTHKVVLEKNNKKKKTLRLAL